MIGLLMVMVIIMILVGEGYFKKDKDSGKTQADAYIDRAKVTACIAERAALQSDFTTSLMQGGGLPSPAIVQAKMAGRRRCPDGDALQFDTQGNVYCPVHSPAPDDAEVFEIPL